VYPLLGVPTKFLAKLYKFASYYYFMNKREKKEILVETDEYKKASSPNVLSCSPGPCYCLVVYDPKSKTAYMSHSHDDFFIKYSIDKIIKSYKKNINEVKVYLRGGKIYYQDYKNKSEAEKIHFPERILLVEYIKKHFNEKNIDIEFNDGRFALNIYFDIEKGELICTPLKI